MPKILVTGATGFIGSRLVERLRQVGFAVRTFGRQPAPAERLSCLDIEHVQGDICAPDSIASALNGIEAVFHLAGLVSYKRVDYDELYKANVLGTRHVMNACLEAGVARVIHLGSIAGMGIPKDGSLGTEEIEYNLKGHGLHYCDTKYEAEQEVMRFARKGLPVLSLNPGITFGEGDTHAHHHTIFRSMAGGWMIGYPEGGVMFTDIEDLVNVCLTSLVAGEPGERYVIGSANVSYREAGETLARVLNGRPPRLKIPGWVSEAAGLACEIVFPLLKKSPVLTWQVAWLSRQKIFFSADRAVNVLGLKQTSFEETLKRTAPYYLSRQEAR